MTYRPIDTDYFASDRPTASVVPYISTLNAETVGELRLNGWGLYWPLGVMNPEGSEDIADAVGMVYTGGHLEDSLDYSGLYVSTPAGRPMTIPIPVVLTGRASKVRVLVTYSMNAAATGGGVVHMGAQVAREGRIYPRPWTAEDLLGGLIPSSVAWDNCQNLDDTTVGAEGWGVASFLIDDIPITYSDDAPGDGSFREASHVLLTILSNFIGEEIPGTSTGVSQIPSPIEWVVTGSAGSIKPHKWLRYIRPTAVEQDDFAQTRYAYVLQSRFAVGANQGTFIIWPPYDPGYVPFPIDIIDAPAIRILAIRIEEVR